MILELLALGGVCLAAAWLGMSSRLSPGTLASVCVMWTGTGVAVVGLYLLGAARWPAVLGSFLLGHVLFPHSSLSGSFGLALLVAGITTVEALLGAWLLRRLRFESTLARVQDVLAFTVTAAVCTLPELLLRLLAEEVGFAMDGASGFPLGLLVWLEWLGQIIGMLVVGPVGLFLAARSAEPRGFEALVLAVLVLSTSLWSFTGNFLAAPLGNVQIFLLFPLAVWASLRFGPRGVAFTTLIVAMVALRGFLQHCDEKPCSPVLVHNLQFFLTVTAFSGLLFAAAQFERTSAHSQLELLATVVRGVRDGVVICEMRPRQGGWRPILVYANESFLQMGGWRFEDLVDRSPLELVADAPDSETVQRLVSAARLGDFFSGEVGLAHRDGSRVSTEMLMSPVRGEDGRVTYLVGTHRDITAQKQLQAKLVAAERIAAVGTLAAGVGHEINNPLAYLLLHLEGAVRGLKRGPEELNEVRAKLEYVRESAERIRLIARDLKVFSRQQGEEREMLDLNDVVVPALRMAAHAVAARGRLVQELSPSPRVMGCESRLGQVMLNLLVNALQSLPEGDPEHHEVRVRTGEDGAGHALVEVSDTGCGMSPGVMARIFEPYFTTKRSAEGTGLGLAICQQIVQSHGGELRVRSEPGKGSIFTVLLPAAEPSSAERPLAPESAPVPHSPPRRRILVIDDEPRLAQSMRMLIEPTHEVVVTTRGAEALAWVSAGQRFDLVLCDLQMPETTGIDIHAHLRAHAPELAERLVFMSGGAYTQVMRDFVRSVRNRILEKPVRPEDLLATIDEALATQSAA